MKLPYLNHLNEVRTQVALRYLDQLAEESELILPSFTQDESHVWHLFVILASDRERLRARLQAKGVESRIHYPTLVPFQQPYSSFGYRPGAFPIAEKLFDRCLSLPMYPELTSDEIDYTIEQLKCALHE